MGFVSYILENTGCVIITITAHCSPCKLNILYIVYIIRIIILYQLNGYRLIDGLGFVHYYKRQKNNNSVNYYNAYYTEKKHTILPSGYTIFQINNKK